MPVGKPTTDGEIVMGSRHYGGAARIAAAAPWDCPACGLKNDGGRKVEQGCAHCGSGDPTKSKAGTPAVDLPAPEIQVQQRPPRNPGGAPLRPSAAPAVEPQVLRVLRIVEYLIKPGADADRVLRNSLVGRMEMGWGSLTATIVDSCDARQEDLLSLARRQPGVWLANETAMREADKLPLRARPPVVLRPHEIIFQMDREDRMADTQPPPMPSVGPSVSDNARAIARNMVRLWGLKFAHTVALALSTIAEELRGNMEPLKFMSAEECLDLANALLQEIPNDWNPEPPAIPPAGDEAPL